MTKHTSRDHHRPVERLVRQWRSVEMPQRIGASDELDQVLEAIRSVRQRDVEILAVVEGRARGGADREQVASDSGGWLGSGRSPCRDIGTGVELIPSLTTLSPMDPDRPQFLFGVVDPGFDVDDEDDQQRVLRLQ